MTGLPSGLNQPAPAVRRVGDAAGALVMLITALDWVGWATGIQILTRIYPTWPQMTPWTALWLFALSVAILAQAGDPSPARVRVARVLALAVGGFAALVLAEYDLGRGFGLDQLWFGDAVRALQSTYPGRPSPQTAISVLALSVTVGLMRWDRQGARTLWALSWAAAMAAPVITALAYMFGAVRFARLTGTTGMAAHTALCLLLLGAAAVLLRPQRGLVAWLLTRPNRQSLIQISVVIAGLPIIVGLSRAVFRGIGLDSDATLVFSTAVGTGFVCSMAYYLIQRDERQRAAIVADRLLLHASADSMLDPQVLLEAVRDPDGQVVDFRYLRVNSATCHYLGLQESDLVGQTQFRSTPYMANSKLRRRYVQCLEDGKPVVLDDLSYFNAILDETRHYDIRATLAGPDLLSLTWRDVTDRSRAAQRIAESEQNYRLLAENAADVIVHIRDGEIVWVSPSVEVALGAPPEYWVGRRFEETVPVEDAPDIADLTATVLAGGLVQQRVRVVGVDGTTHWFHMSAKPFYGADGNEDGALSTLRLIDDEVAAEQATAEARRQQARAETRYRRTMDDAAIGMCLMAPDGTFIEFNDAFCEFFGYDADTLMRKTWQDLTAPEYLQADLEHFNDVLAGRQESYRMVKQYLHADGHRIWGDLSVSCTRDESGRVENFIKQIVDITARVAAQEALEASDEQNRLLAQRLQKQSDKMASELESAAAYMASIMPSALSGPVDVASRYLPSQELGGECFDYTWIDDDHLLVYLIDVSGHGIEPVLLSVSVHNMLRSGSLGTEIMLAPESALAELNRLFRMEDQDDHFFTIWYGVYEPSTRTLRYASAGAPPAFAFGTAADGYSITELSTATAPIGIFEDTEFTSHSYPVPHGCRVLIYSDGAHAIALSEGQFLSLEEFKNMNTRLASNFSLDSLIEELKARTTTGIFEDDLSLIQLTFD